MNPGWLARKTTGLYNIPLLVDQEFNHDRPLDSALAEISRIDRRRLRARPRRAIELAQSNRV